MSEFFSINFSVNSSLCEDEDSEKWISAIKGEVFFYDEDTDEEVLVGKARFFYVDIALSSWYPFDLLDTMSGTAPFIEPLYGYDRTAVEFNSHVCELLEYDYLSPNLFILDRIEIIPQHRGKGLTQEIIKETCRLFSGKADVIALKVCPLQHENNRQDVWGQKMQLNKLEQDPVKAENSLTSYYKKLGFKYLGNENVMLKLIELYRNLLF